jgi:WD40 repeat protein
MENGRSSKVEYALKASKWVRPGVVKFISADELFVTNENRGSSRVLIYNVETGVSNFCSNIGGMEISQVKCIESYDQGFTVAFDGGHVVTIDKRSKEVISDFRLNNACVGLGWARDGFTLLAGDERANLYTFDARSNKCSVRTQLETISSMSSFTLNGESLAACGSPFGTVDVVDTATWVPVVSFDKLVTGVDSLAFHPIQKSMLIAGSTDKRNAVRMYECSTGRTLPGWPTDKDPIGRAQDIKFSDCGRFFAIGCNSGHVQLYAL